MIQERSFRKTGAMIYKTYNLRDISLSKRPFYYILEICPEESGARSRNRKNIKRGSLRTGDAPNDRLIIL